jgi:hypothetical protein
MTDSDQDLRERFRSGLRPSDGRACPSPAELWDAAAGTLPFERLRDVVDHGARCAQCSEALRIARDVRSELPSETPVPAVRPRRRDVPVLVGLGVAAAIGAFLVLRPPPPGAGAVERGMTGAVPSEALRALSPDRQAPGAVLLRWSAYPGARSYNVTVLTSELSVVHRAVGLAEQQLRVPESAIGPDGAARELLWNVDAVLPDGRTVGSPTFRLRIQ